MQGVELDRLLPSHWERVLYDSLVIVTFALLRNTIPKIARSGCEEAIVWGPMQTQVYMQRVFGMS